MKLGKLIWKSRIIEKLERKHNVSTIEVEEVMYENTPHVRFIQKGDVEGEDLYVAYGRTFAGRYLIVFFIYKHDQNVLPISARDMDRRERRQYARHKHH